MRLDMGRPRTIEGLVRSDERRHLGPRLSATATPHAPSTKSGAPYRAFPPPPLSFPIQCGPLGSPPSPSPLSNCKTQLSLGKRSLSLCPCPRARTRRRIATSGIGRTRAGEAGDNNDDAGKVGSVRARFDAVRVLVDALGRVQVVDLDLALDDDLAVRDEHFSDRRHEDKVDCTVEPTQKSAEVQCLYQSETQSG